MRYLKDQFDFTYNLPNNTSNIMGRKSDCDIPVPPLQENAFDDIYFDISRQHARINTETEHCTIEDLYSTNGVKVNGEFLEPRQPCQLNEGDKIELGRIALTYYEG